MGPVLDRCKRRMQTEISHIEGQLPFLCGRITLIKATLSNLRSATYCYLQFPRGLRRTVKDYKSISVKRSTRIETPPY